MSRTRRERGRLSWPLEDSACLPLGSEVRMRVEADLARAGRALPPCAYSDDPAYGERADGRCSEKGCAFRFLAPVERAGRSSRGGRVALRDFPSVKGGFVALYPVRRDSVDARALLDARVVCDTGLGFSLDDMEFHDLLYTGWLDALFDPGLPENRARAEASAMLGGGAREAAFEWSLEENFYEVAALADARGRALRAAEALESRRPDATDVPPLARAAVEQGRHTEGELADFYRRFAEKVRPIALLDPVRYVVSFCGP